jgi:hypothetical protein
MMCRGDVRRTIALETMKAHKESTLSRRRPNAVRLQFLPSSMPRIQKGATGLMTASSRSNGPTVDLAKASACLKARAGFSGESPWADS